MHWMQRQVQHHWQQTAETVALVIAC